VSLSNAKFGVFTTPTNIYDFFLLQTQVKKVYEVLANEFTNLQFKAPVMVFLSCNGAFTSPFILCNFALCFDLFKLALAPEKESGYGLYIPA